MTRFSVHNKWILPKLPIIIFLVLGTYRAPAQDSSAYRVYTGKIGTREVSLAVCIDHKSYTGYIWFNAEGWPMALYGGARVAATDSISLSAGSGPVMLALAGIFTDESYNGRYTLQFGENAPKTGLMTLQISHDPVHTAFGYFSAEDSSKLPSRLKNESTSDFIMGTIWPTGNTPLEESIQSQVRRIMHVPAAAVTPLAAMRQQVRRSATAWRNVNSKISLKESADMGLSLSEQEETRIMVMYENARYIILANYNYSYTGGAHGNYGTSLLTLDKRNGKRLSLSNILTPQGIKALPQLLDQAARIQFSVGTNAPLDQNYFLVKAITVSKNWYISSAGLGFLYAPYEIRSFADGEINLLIPAAALKQYLRPGIVF